MSAERVEFPSLLSANIDVDDALDDPPTFLTASAHCDGVVATSATSTSTSAMPLTVDARKSPSRRTRAVRGVATSDSSGAASSIGTCDVACPPRRLRHGPRPALSAVPGVDGTLADAIFAFDPSTKGLRGMNAGSSRGPGARRRAMCLAARSMGSSNTRSARSAFQQKVWERF